ANDPAKGVVDGAGMSWTIGAAAGKSRPSRGASESSAAGPPVDAAMSTQGVASQYRRSWFGGALDVATTAEGGAAVARLAVRTGRTRDAMRTLLTISSRRASRPRSTVNEGLATKSTAPSSSARMAADESRRVYALIITMGVGRSLMIR